MNARGLLCACLAASLLPAGPLGKIKSTAKGAAKKADSVADKATDKAKAGASKVKDTTAKGAHEAKQDAKVAAGAVKGGAKGAEAGAKAGASQVGKDVKDLAKTASPMHPVDTAKAGAKTYKDANLGVPVSAAKGGMQGARQGARDAQTGKTADKKK